MAVGVFDPDVRAESWFDPDLTAEGWLDPDLIDVAVAAGGGGSVQNDLFVSRIAATH